ncbi:unnamed protein product [Miscanthus lutarioriparius]|uniref:Uncharacterized protein n=1 Tax=Miscanthus lutarioriparius TaxID=422564 RepID=A0A811MK83_9POAL|nr:unnamed protein product [Miscanthus lutarioriparius]
MAANLRLLHLLPGTELCLRSRALTLLSSSRAHGMIHCRREPPRQKLVTYRQGAFEEGNAGGQSESILCGLDEALGSIMMILSSAIFCLTPNRDHGCICKKGLNRLFPSDISWNLVCLKKFRKSKYQQVSKEEGEGKANDPGVMFIETSAKAGFNIKSGDCLKTSKSRWCRSQAKPESKWKLVKKKAAAVLRMAKYMLLIV